MLERQGLLFNFTLSTRKKIVLKEVLARLLTQTGLNENLVRPDAVLKTRNASQQIP